MHSGSNSTPRWCFWKCFVAPIFGLARFEARRQGPYARRFRDQVGPQSGPQQATLPPVTLKLPPRFLLPAALLRGHGGGVCRRQVDNQLLHHKKSLNVATHAIRTQTTFAFAQSHYDTLPSLFSPCAESPAKLMNPHHMLCDQICCLLVNYTLRTPKVH